MWKAEQVFVRVRPCGACDGKALVTEAGFVAIKLVQGYSLSGAAPQLVMLALSEVWTVHMQHGVG